MLRLILDELLLRREGDPSQILQRTQGKPETLSEFLPVKSIARQSSFDQQIQLIQLPLLDRAARCTSIRLLCQKHVSSRSPRDTGAHGSTGDWWHRGLSTSGSRDITRDRTPNTLNITETSFGTNPCANAPAGARKVLAFALQVTGCAKILHGRSQDVLYA
jgi:hypothetical protein